MKLNSGLADSYIAILHNPFGGLLNRRRVSLHPRRDLRTLPPPVGPGRQPGQPAARRRPARPAEHRGHRGEEGRGRRGGRGREGGGSGAGHFTRQQLQEMPDIFSGAAFDRPIGHRLEILISRRREMCGISSSAGSGQSCWAFGVLRFWRTEGQAARLTAGVPVGGWQTFSVDALVMHSGVRLGVLGRV